MFYGVDFEGISLLCDETGGMIGSYVKGLSPVAAGIVDFFRGLEGFPASIGTGFFLTFVI